MPNSLRSRLNKLVYKGLLEKDDLKRIIILPIDATNGDVVKAIFPDIKILEHGKTDICDAYIQIDIWDFAIFVSKDWWNAKFER